MKKSFIIGLLIAAILLFWQPTIKADETFGPKPNSVLLVICGIIGGTIVIAAGYILYKSVCKLRQNIHHQQSEPDEDPPVINTNAPQKKLAIPNLDKTISLYANETGSQTLDTDSGWLVTDISAFSATNARFVDRVIGKPYTIWGRTKVVSSTNLVDLLTNASSTTFKLKKWVSSEGNNQSNKIMSVVIVTSGGNVPAMTNYYQAYDPNGYSYTPSLNDGSFCEVIGTSTVPIIDPSVPRKFFKLSAVK